jgi:hypothetical protein
MRKLPDERLRNMIKARVSTAALGNWGVLLIDADYGVHEYYFPHADREDVRFMRAVHDRRLLQQNKELLAVVHLGFPADLDVTKAMVEYVPDHTFYSLDYRIQPAWANDADDGFFEDGLAMYREIWTEKGGIEID